MTSADALAAVPVARRRRSAVVALAFAVVLAVAGVLPWTAPAAGVIRFVAVVLLLAAGLAGLVAFGLVRSLRAPVRTSSAAGGGCGGGCQCGR